jgi:hypothetical protein
LPSPGGADYYTVSGTCFHENLDDARLIFGARASDRSPSCWARHLVDDGGGTFTFLSLSTVRAVIIREMANGLRTAHEEYHALKEIERFLQSNDGVGAFLNRRRDSLDFDPFDCDLYAIDGDLIVKADVFSAEGLLKPEKDCQHIKNMVTSRLLRVLAELEFQAILAESGYDWLPDFGFDPDRFDQALPDSVEILTVEGGLEADLPLAGNLVIDPNQNEIIGQVWAEFPADGPHAPERAIGIVTDGGFGLEISEELMAYLETLDWSEATSLNHLETSTETLAIVGFNLDSLVEFLDLYDPERESLRPYD